MRAVVLLAENDHVVKRVVDVIARRRFALEAGLFGLLPLACLGWLSWFVAGNGGGRVFAIFRRAGIAVSRGHTPYRLPTTQVMAQGDGYVYTQPFAYLFVPFRPIPEWVGAVVFLLISALAVCIAIRLLGGTDWRCYGAAILTLPVYDAFRLGAIGPVLLLLVAVGWRYRDGAAGGIALALAAAVKLFLWPVLLWLVFTRRLRGSIAAVATIAVVLGIWAVADLPGLREYPTTLRVLDEVYRKGSYSSQALALALGASHRVAAVVPIVLALVGVGVIYVLRQRERDAFTAAVVVALLATPILWMHYLVLLIVPLMLLSPTLSVWWLALVPLWATSRYASGGESWRLLVALFVVAAVALAPRVSWRRSPEAPAAQLA